MSIDFYKKISYTYYMKKIFGNRLKELRIKEGESRKDLAQLLNVDVSMISFWESGKSYPEISRLIELANHYNVSLDYILGLSK